METSSPKSTQFLSLYEICSNNVTNHASKKDIVSFELPQEIKNDLLLMKNEKIKLDLILDKLNNHIKELNVIYNGQRKLKCVLEEIKTNATTHNYKTSNNDLRNLRFIESVIGHCDSLEVIRFTVIQKEVAIKKEIKYIKSQLFHQLKYDNIKAEAQKYTRYLFRLSVYSKEKKAFTNFIRGQVREKLLKGRRRIVECLLIPELQETMKSRDISSDNIKSLELIHRFVTVKFKELQTINIDILAISSPDQFTDADNSTQMLEEMVEKLSKKIVELKNQKLYQNKT